MKKLLILLFLMPLISFANTPKQNIQLITQMYQQVLQKRNPAAVPKFYSKSYKQYSNLDPVLNYQGLVKHVKGFQQKFSYVHVLPFINTFAYDDKVIVKYKAVGKMKSGKQIQSVLLAVWQIKNGKIIRNWEVASGHSNAALHVKGK